MTTNDDGQWIWLSDDSAEQLAQVCKRSGVITADDCVDWLIRAMAEHYRRIDRENEKDRTEGPVEE